MEEYMEAKKKAREMENYFQAVIDSDEDFVDDIVQVSKLNKGSCASTPSLKTKVSTSRPKGPLDLYMIPDPETAVMKRKGKGQQKINENDNVRKELRARACTAFARWMYDAGIPFNAVNYDSFPVMVEAFGQYGPNMKPPSYHETELHGLAALQWSICQDSLTRMNDARVMYEKLQSHPNVRVSKQARDFVFGFQAMEMLKVRGSTPLTSTDYQNYFDAFVKDKSTYSLEEKEVNGGAFSEVLPYMVFLCCPILIVLLIAVQKGI